MLSQIQEKWQLWRPGGEFKVKLCISRRTKHQGEPQQVNHTSKDNFSIDNSWHSLLHALSNQSSLNQSCNFKVISVLNLTDIHLREWRCDFNSKDKKQPL